MTAITSTALFFDRSAAAMGTLSARADALNTQISTTRRLQAPSDDAVAYQQLQTLARGGADAKAAAANIAVAQSVLAQGDTTLSSVTSQLQQASELALQARNGTLNDSDRAAIAEQLSGIAESLASLANTTDLRGQPLFGGADGEAAATGSGTTHTLAATAAPAIPIGDGQSVQANESAARVFGLGDGGNVIDLVAGLAAALRDGGDTDAATGDAITALQGASTQVASVQASLGARAARVDLEASRLKEVATDREASRSALEDTDVTQAITELQKTMTVLQATQASFAKLSSLSLFDYLR